MTGSVTPFAERNDQSLGEKRLHQMSEGPVVWTWPEARSSVSYFGCLDHILPTTALPTVGFAEFWPPGAPGRGCLGKAAFSGPLLETHSDIPISQALRSYAIQTTKPVGFCLTHCLQNSFDPRSPLFQGAPAQAPVMLWEMLL